MSVDPQQLLRELFATAIDAAHPQQVLEAHLPTDRSGRVIVIGAGKAAAAMARVVERCWQGEVSGLVVTRYGHGAPCRRIVGQVLHFACRPLNGPPRTSQHPRHIADSPAPQPPRFERRIPPPIFLRQRLIKPSHPLFYFRFVPHL
jgi:hypothetical protein